MIMVAMIIMIIIVMVMIIIVIVITRAAPVQGAASCPHGCSKGGSEGEGGTYARAVCGMEGQPISKESALDD